MKLREKMTGRTKIERIMKTDLEDFRKECLRYGEILSSREYVTEDKKNVRLYTLYINGFRANIKMVNGETVEGGLSIEKIYFENAIDN